MALGTDCQREEPVDPHERGSAKLPVELKSTLGQQDTPEGMTDEEAEKARWTRSGVAWAFSPVPAAETGGILTPNPDSAIYRTVLLKIYRGGCHA